MSWTENPPPLLHSLGSHVTPPFIMLSPLFPPYFLIFILLPFFHFSSLPYFLIFILLPFLHFSSFHISLPSPFLPFTSRRRDPSPLCCSCFTFRRKYCHRISSLFFLAQPFLPLLLPSFSSSSFFPLFSFFFSIPFLLFFHSLVSFPSFSFFPPFLSSFFLYIFLLPHRSHILILFLLLQFSPIPFSSLSYSPFSTPSPLPTHLLLILL